MDRKLTQSESQFAYIVPRAIDYKVGETSPYWTGLFLTGLVIIHLAKKLRSKT